jgi:hypothetical protein
MGVWATPYMTDKQAKFFAKKMKTPWRITLENIEGHKTRVLKDSFNLIGCDEFQDMVWEIPEGSDMRCAVAKWIVENQYYPLKGHTKQSALDTATIAALDFLLMKELERKEIES